MASPDFTINGGAPGADAQVVAAGLVTCQLNSLDGITEVEWEIAGVDAGSVNDYALSTSGFLGSIMTYTALAAGSAANIKCRVNAGVDPRTGNNSEAMTTTAVAWVPTATGLRVKAEGEDGSATARDTAIINAAVRAVDAGTGGGGGVTNDPVRAVTLANVSLSACPVSQDGVTLVAGNRLGVVAQSIPRDNGIYVVGTVGGGTAPLTRATDFDTTPEVQSGAAFFVQEGSQYAGATATLVTPDPITLGSTDLTFRLEVPLLPADKVRYDQVQAGVNASAVAMTDANQTLTVAGGRRYVQTTPITAPRQKILGTTGAVAGDLMTLERVDKATYPEEVVNGGPAAGTIAVLTGPRPTASFRYDGANWAKHGQLPDTTGWPVFNVRDYGAKGDERLGFTLEASQIQACIDDAARFARAYAYVSGAVIEFPPGVYHTNGTPLIMRRTPYNAPLVYRGAGIGTTTIQNSTGVGAAGDCFRVESIAEEPDATWGGNHHVFQDMSFSSPNGHCIVWDLGEAGDTYGGSGDPVRSSFYVDRCYFSASTMSGAAVRYRHCSRAKMTNCYFEVANQDAGAVGLEVIRGSASMIGCVGGGQLMYVRDGGEITISNCRGEGSWGTPAFDFCNVNGMVMSGVTTEGHGEGPSVYRFRGVKNLVADLLQVASISYSYVVMRGHLPISGAPAVVITHLPGVGTAYGEQNMIRRATGSWWTDKIGNGTKVKLTNAVTNTAWYTVRESTHDTLWVEETLTDETIAAATGTGAVVRPTLTRLPTVTFAAAGNTMTRNASSPSAAGSWIVDGFAIGQVVTPASTLNPGPFTVTNVTDTVLTVSGGVVDEGPVASLRFRSNVPAGGITFENCWNFNLRGCAGSDFTQAGDQSRKTVEVGTGCRDGDISFALYNSIYDAYSCDPSAYNVVCEVRATAYTDPFTLNPGQSVTYWHGQKHFDEVALEQPDGVVVNQSRHLTPNAICGYHVRRGLTLGVDNHHTGLWWDEGTQKWILAYDDNGVHDLLADLGARNKLEILEALFYSTAIIRAASGQTVNFFDDATLMAYFQLVAGVGKLRSGTTDFAVTTAGDLQLESGDDTQISAGGDVDLNFSGSTVSKLGLRLNAATGGAELYRVVPLANPQTGTGITTPQEGRARYATTTRTFTYAAFSSGGASAFVRFDDLPAKTRVCSVICATSAQFMGGGVLTSEIRVGTEDDDNGYILEHSVFSAAATKGLADADLGVYLARATAVQGGHIPSWTDSKELRVQLDVTGDTLDHLTSGTVTLIVGLEYLG